MPATWSTPRVWVAAERVGASKMNEISNGLGVLYPYTTAGDLAYRDAAGAYLSRLAITPGGLLYGGASAPAYLGLAAGDLVYRGASLPTALAKGTALQQLRMDAAGNYPEWAARILPIHASGLGTASGTSTSSTSYVTAGLCTLDLTLTKVCTIVAFAYGVAYTDTGVYYPYFRLNIDGTGDAANIPMSRAADLSPGQPFTTMWFRNSIAAGTRTVKLEYKVSNGAETCTIVAAQMIVFALEE